MVGISSCSVETGSECIKMQDLWGQEENNHDEAWQYCPKMRIKEKMWVLIHVSGTIYAFYIEQLLTNKIETSLGVESRGFLSYQIGVPSSLG